MNGYRKYIIVLIITCGIFFTAFLTSSYISEHKVQIIENTADKISIDILSLETQFELFEETSCESLQSTILSDEINALGERLSFAENERGIDDEDVITLKKYYSLLEIKDYLLMKKVQERCESKKPTKPDAIASSTSPIAILYFYSNENCDDCTKQGYVLTRLRELEPRIKVYSFDYNLDLGAIKTLINVQKIGDVMPAIVADDKTLQGFQSLEDMTAKVQSLSHLKDRIYETLDTSVDKDDKASESSTATATTPR